MGKPLMLQQADADRIDRLKRRLRAKTKVEVVRSALDLLERQADREERVRQWRRAVRAVVGESRRVNLELQKGTRLRRID